MRVHICVHEYVCVRSREMELRLFKYSSHLVLIPKGTEVCLCVLRGSKDHVTWKCGVQMKMS